MTHWPISPNYSPFPMDASHPYFVFDHNRCILCRRCVRACANLVGNFTLDMENRGARTMVVADYGLPMGESSCIRCGTCVQSCPTGALIDRNSAYLGLEKDAESFDSVCVACSVGCGIQLMVRDNRIIRVLGDWDAPVNGGVICTLGRYETMEEKRLRINVPMMRRNGGLAPATWDEAIQAVTDKLQGAGENVSALVSSRLPAEALYAFQQLFEKGLNSKMVASIEENLTSASLQDAALWGSLDELKKADCVLVIGADLVKSHQVAGFFVKRNRPNGVSIIVIDPFENEMDEVAHYSLKPTEGSDIPLLEGLLTGLVNLGMDKGITTHGKANAIGEAAAATGIPAETLLAVSRELGMANAPVIVFGKGVTGMKGQTGSREATLSALEALAQAAGAVLINPMGKANSAAAHSYGLDRTFKATGQDLVYLALGDDFPTPRLEKSVTEAPFLVIQASHTSSLTERADVVLPVEMWSEQEGHYLNLEGRLQKAQRVVSPGPQVHSNQSVFQAIAEALELSLDGNWKTSLQVKN
jgi:formate dehydrogenase major subunit